MPGGDVDINQDSISLGMIQSAAVQKSVEQEAEMIKTIPDAENISDEARDPNLAVMRRGMNAKSESLKERVDKFKEVSKSSKENPFEKEANEFANKHKGHRANILAQLRQDIEEDSKNNTEQDYSPFSNDKASDRVFAIVSRYYPDDRLGAEAFDFLLQTTTDPALHETVKKAKASYIEYGQNLTNAAAVAAKKYASKVAATGTGKSLDPADFKDLNAFFREVAFGGYDYPTVAKVLEKYPYADLLKITQYIFHALGVEIKKQPEAPLLKSLMTQTQNVRAFLNVYRLFKGWNSVNKQLDKIGAKPPGYSFELLTREFMKLALDRNPTHEKVLSVPKHLKIEPTKGQIIIVNALRDAVRMVAPLIFQNKSSHLISVIIEVSQELEDVYADEQESLLAQEDIQVDSIG